jgi:polyisoprenoid-binding protein YceI
MNTTSNFLASTLLALGMVSVAMTGCDDPAKGKAKATSSDVAASATAQSTAANADAVKYAFDQSSSKVAWVGSKITGKHEGGFATFAGTVDLVESAPDKSRVVVDIEADSLTSDTEKLTTHLKSPDFFDTKTHPKATFTSTAIAKGGEKGATHTITGNLTIKGITKSITFPATLSVSGDAAKVDAEFAINRRDYSLNYAGMPNDLIRDDVLIKLTIRANKAKS